MDQHWQRIVERMEERENQKIMPTIRQLCAL
jgi:hypothetical protein